MEDKIKALVKELFDSGMTLDEIIETVASIAMTEDFKRSTNHELNNLRPRGILTIVLAIYLAAELLTGVIGMLL